MKAVDIKKLFLDITESIQGILQSIQSITSALEKGYAFQQYTGNASLTSGQAKSFEVEITTHGNPVLVMASGTWNGDAGGYWAEIYISRVVGETVTALSQATMVSSAAGYNMPGSVVYLDTVSAGTYKYRCTIQSGSGSGTFAENNHSRSEAPVLCAIEI